MNYWLLTTEYPPFHGGGISTYCHFTALMLAEMGHKVTVFVQDDSVGDFNIAGTLPGIRLCRFNSNRNKLHASLGYAARLSYAFADIVKTCIASDGAPDVLEAQDYLGIAYYLTQQKHLGYPFLKDIPIAITLHSPAFIYLEYNRVPTYRFPDFWTGEMEKQAIKAADLLISPTRFLVDEIGRFMDISGVPLEVLANPYAADSPAAAADSPAAAPESTARPGAAAPAGFSRNKIVYYGKLSPQKAVLSC
ncbi:glycosyltransferase family 4 protein [Puia sp. P3]|uniref:glycosyltransferase family 4 protein n=1 Tax=Puia sp. P3 TaxID=3423952 RepID=UPI003D6691D2